jgi:hypothetical protein
MDNEFWVDIWGGDSSYDIYDDNQAVLNELYPPEPERNTVQLDLITFEDVPF